MKLRSTSDRLRNLAFRMSRAVPDIFGGGRISAFGKGDGTIGQLLIVNLDRQPQRLRQTLRELDRFSTNDGASLASLAHRLPAVDARDGRAVAATADVDPTYRMGDQLYVQPDATLEECFGVEEPIRMTRQEVAVARSHIEAWKATAAGSSNHVLVLEDDVWFKQGAATAIDRGWRAAAERCVDNRGPRFIYLSYSDAGGSTARTEICDALFRPTRGLWFLSGYVLSREGAEILLRSMPVVGPVDMWINYQFEKLGALALSSPAILQRPDGGSENSYSVLPYLARAGIVDASVDETPLRAAAGPVMAWTAGHDRDGLAMALSMLGLRVCAFDGDEDEIRKEELPNLLETFDALVDAPLSPDTLTTAIEQPSTLFVLETNGHRTFRTGTNRLPTTRTAVLPAGEITDALWQPLCALLGLAVPIQPFPVGPPRTWRVFRDDRATSARRAASTAGRNARMDDSAWALLPEGGWPFPPCHTQRAPSFTSLLLCVPMTNATPLFRKSIETFPGNLAAFAEEGLVHDANGAHLILSKNAIGNRPYRSGAFASVRSFEHGRFEADIKAASGSGLITGFFLHRENPRQEIDIELSGNDPHRMLVNVFFNPGDDGTAMEFGYRGSPCRVELGFDATSDFHRYAIDWRPDCISWSVDGRTVHIRVGWDPTPIPHLPMRLHANLWAPRSAELAGKMNEFGLPSLATFRNVSIWT